MSGKLILCATPIGNLGDISERVLQALRDADRIAAEDTRNSRKLLNHFDIHTPMISYHENNRYDRGRELVELMRGGVTIALITDAGTPAISDPGEELVAMAYEAGIEVTSLPGPAACITALTLSGLPTKRFVMEGFLPRDKKERAEILEELKDETRTIILYEAPHRLKKTLRDLADALGEDRRISLCRELTKIHEEVLRTTLGAAAPDVDPAPAADLQPRGEYVLVIEGKSRESMRKEKQAAWEELSIQEHLERYLSEGLSEKDAMKQVARDRGCGKREIYAAIKTR